MAEWLVFLLCSWHYIPLDHTGCRIVVSLHVVEVASVLLVLVGCWVAVWPYNRTGCTCAYMTGWACTLAC